MKSYILYTILTIIELVAVTGDNLESGAAAKVGLELIPDTLTVSATVTQLNDHSQRCRTSTTCIIGTKPTTPRHLNLVHISTTSTELNWTSSGREYVCTTYKTF